MIRFWWKINHFLPFLYLKNTFHLSVQMCKFRVNGLHFFYSFRISSVFLPLLVFGFGLILSSCHKAEYADTSLLPGTDLVHAKYDNSQRILSCTKRQDSVLSDETSLNLAGSIKDNTFGTTVAGFYAQVRLNGDSFRYGAAPHLDSVVLTLAYYSYYGDTTTPLIFHAQELNEDISKTTDYYSNRVPVTGLPLGFTRVAPRPADSVVVGGVVTSPHLRIHLNDDFGNRLIAAEGKGQLYNDDAFLPVFKGIYVYAEPAYLSNSGSIISFDLLNPQSKITVYFNYGTVSRDFVFTSNSARVNFFKHDYTGTEIDKQLKGTAGDTNAVFVQGASGVGTHISFPDIKHLADSGKVIINKAELMLSVAPGTETPYGPPLKLLLSRVGASGEDLVLPDQFNGTTYFGGSYLSSSKQYSFNLSKYVQDVIEGKYTDYGINLLPAGSAISAVRTVLGGGAGTAAIPKKLNITYTRY